MAGQQLPTHQVHQLVVLQQQASRSKEEEQVVMQVRDAQEQVIQLLQVGP
jgi:hypothetical protein